MVSADARRQIFRLRLTLPRDFVIQILYEADHLKRAETLAAAIPGSKYDLVGSPPSAAKKLDTLVFWGHGTQSFLCGLTVAGFRSVVKEWKKLNSSLKTVEIITCDARHAAGKDDPFVTMAKAALSGGMMSSTRNIVLKALPVHINGSQDALSILLADWQSKSWCYITAPGPTGKALHLTKDLIIKEAKPFGDDLARTGDKVVRQVKDRKFTLNYGYFNTLRAQLGVVK